jgi:hypothetical protein
MPFIDTELVDLREHGAQACALPVEFPERLCVLRGLPTPWSHVVMLKPEREHT